MKKGDIVIYEGKAVKIIDIDKGVNIFTWMLTETGKNVPRESTIGI